MQLADLLRRSDASLGLPARVRACAALQHLLRRLQPYMDVQGVRRDASAWASKVVPQLLTALGASTAAASPGAGDAQLALAALGVLGALLQAVPSTLRAADAACEAALVAVMTHAAEGGCNSGGGGGGGAAALLAAAECLAQLPRAAGDADAWSSLARRVLLSTHETLDALLLGLEGAPWDPRARSLLAPGLGAPGPAGLLPPRAGLPAARQHQACRALLAGLVHCLEAMCSRPYPVAVPVPGYSVLAVAARLLQFDGGLALASGAVPHAASALAPLLALQPALHATGLQLLELLMSAAGGQLLTLQGSMARLLCEQLRGIRLGGAAALAAQPPALRQQLYATASRFLTAAGFGVLSGLGVEVLGSCLVELYGRAAGAADGQAGAAAAAAPGLAGGGQARKKQKTGGQGLSRRQRDGTEGVFWWWEGQGLWLCNSLHPSLTPWTLLQL